MNDEDMKREHLSALADGELQDEEFVRALAYAGTPQGQSAWRMYHLIGDTLRSPSLAHVTHAADPALLGRLREQLAQEPRPDGLAPAALAIHAAPQVRTEAANASVFRWKLAAGFASLAAVVAVGWNGYVGPTGAAASRGAQLAVVLPQPAADWPPPFVATAAQPQEQPPVMIRDPRLDELLAAHRQYGNTTALQMPAGFLRNATFEAPGR
ncbi:MAG: sigma-E factor negative regulatory protein [Proteobacteria bacterium]|nr:sigma-E factor negative regulatory protein [Pseudomonadota bacterium]